MKTLLTTLCLTIAVLFGSVGMSWGADTSIPFFELSPSEIRRHVENITPRAKRGDVFFQRLLGHIYKRGKGVPQDYKTAVKWYRLAAEQGDALAQTDLGFMYLTGEGVPSDAVLTHMWGNLAASNGNTKGAELRNFVERMMTQSQIAEAQKLARECVRKKYKGC